MSKKILEYIETCKRVSEAPDSDYIANGVEPEDVKSVRTTWRNALNFLIEGKIKPL